MLILFITHPFPHHQQSYYYCYCYRIGIGIGIGIGNGNGRVAVGSAIASVQRNVPQSCANSMHNVTHTHTYAADAAPSRCDVR